MLPKVSLVGRSQAVIPYAVNRKDPYTAYLAQGVSFPGIEAFRSRRGCGIALTSGTDRGTARACSDHGKSYKEADVTGNDKYQHDSQCSLPRPIILSSEEFS